MMNEVLYNEGDLLFEIATDLSESPEVLDRKATDDPYLKLRWKSQEGVGVYHCHHCRERRRSKDETVRRRLAQRRGREGRDRLNR